MPKLYCTPEMTLVNYLPEFKYTLLYNAQKSYINFKLNLVPCINTPLYFALNIQLPNNT